MRPRIRLIGIGNEYRSDDGLGPLIVRELRRRGAVDVTIREAPGDGGSLLALIEDCDVLMLVDAVDAAAEPGTIHRMDGSHEKVTKTSFPTSTHGLGVAEAVETARVLGRLPETVLLYGIEACSFEQGNGLSEAVLKSVPELIRMLEEDISRLSNPESHPHHA